MVKWITAIIFAGIVICGLVLALGAYFLLRSGSKVEPDYNETDYFTEAGWEPKSAPIETKLSSVDFAEMNTGWIVGVDGLILKSDDSGDSWQEQSSGTQVDLYSIDLIDADIGWAVGDKGTILGTLDSGETWESLDSTTHRPLYDVHFISTSTGWVVGGGGLYGSDPELTADNQVILRTDDAGNSWTRQKSASNRALYDVQFINQITGWAVGEKGTILSTVDGGLSWQTEQSGTIEDLVSLHFVDAYNGWVVGPSISTATPAIIIKSSDGGSSWQPAAGDLVGGFMLQDVYFFNPDNGLAIGQVQYYVGSANRTSSGVLVTTDDGGENWLVKQVPTPALISLSFVENDTGWAVGNNGTILKTSGD